MKVTISAHSTAWLHLLLLLLWQYINPIVRNSKHPLKGDLLYAIERVLKLSVPNLYVWLCMFYCFFHLWYVCRDPLSLNIISKDEQQKKDIYLMKKLISVGFSDHKSLCIVLVRRLNILAELLCFGDREFYKDWWNAKSVGDVSYL